MLPLTQALNFTTKIVANAIAPSNPTASSPAVAGPNSGNSTPQDVVTLSFQPQAAQNLSSMSLGQLQGRAFDAADARDQAMEGMFEDISGFSPEDKKGVGRAMFYESAAATGYYNAQTDDGGTRPMTPAELQRGAALMSPEDRASFEADVQAWSSENPVMSKNAMATGAATWVYDNTAENTAPDIMKQRLSLAQNANNVLENNQMATDATFEIFGRDKEYGKQVFEEIK